MRFRTLLQGLAAAASLTLLTGTAGAQTVIVDNLSATNSGTLGFAFMAQQFTTDATSYVLSSVVARVGGGSVAQAVTMQIYGDNAGKPGASLFSLGTQSVLVANFTTFTPSSSFTLNASTTYWVVASNPTATNWRQSAQTPTGTGTFGAFGLSNDGSTWFTFTTGKNTMQVNGVAVSAAVPEPGPMALGAVAGAAGLAARVWSRRRRRAA